jgi:23S rRNA pseudouridine2605 synthase
VRLQKYMAEAGVASRRKCEELIMEGRVQVNGAVVTQLGTTVEPGRDIVVFNGKKLNFEPKKYILFNKPPHVMCTSDDPQGRQTVQDYFKDLGLRLYTVGRLDYDTEGLLIVTNDGEFANALAHPRHNIDKTYYVVCRGAVSPQELITLRTGVRLEDGMTAPAKVRVIKNTPQTSQLLISIHEGRNRQVRRMFAALDHEVTFLRRENVGPLGLEGVAPGKWRELSEGEVQLLKKLAGK